MACCGKKPKSPQYVDKRQVKHKTSKLWLWLAWLIIMVVSIGYCAMSFISFQKIVEVSRFDDNGIQNDILWAVLAASFIGPFTVAAFFFFGSFILAKKTMTESGLTYSYGALHWSSLWMAVVVLQSGVALHGQKHTMQKNWAARVNYEGGRLPANLPWSGGDTSLVIATYVFAYILAICYLFLFFLMFFLRNAAKKLILDGPAQPAAGTGTGHGKHSRASSHSSRSSSDRGSRPAHSAAGGITNATYHESAHPSKTGEAAPDTVVHTQPPPVATSDGSGEKKHRRHGMFGHRKHDEAAPPAETAAPPAAAVPAEGAWGHQRTHDEAPGKEPVAAV